MGSEFQFGTSKTIMALRFLGVAGLALGVHFWRKYWRNELSDERGYETPVEDPASPKTGRSSAGRQHASTASSLPSEEANLISSNPGEFSNPGEPSASVVMVEKGSEGADAEWGSFETPSSTGSSGRTPVSASSSLQYSSPSSPTSTPQDNPSSRKAALLHESSLPAAGQQDAQHAQQPVDAQPVFETVHVARAASAEEGGDRAASQLWSASQDGEVEEKGRGHSSVDGRGVMEMASLSVDAKETPDMPSGIESGPLGQACSGGRGIGGEAEFVEEAAERHMHSTVGEGAAGAALGATEEELLPSSVSHPATAIKELEYSAAADVPLSLATGSQGVAGLNVADAGEAEMTCGGVLPSSPAHLPVHQPADVASPASSAPSPAGELSRDSDISLVDGMGESFLQNRFTSSTEGGAAAVLPAQGSTTDSTISAGGGGCGAAFTQGAAGRGAPAGEGFAPESSSGISISFAAATSQDAPSPFLPLGSPASPRDHQPAREGQEAGEMEAEDIPPTRSPSPVPFLPYFHQEPSLGLPPSMQHAAPAMLPLQPAQQGEQMLPTSRLSLSDWVPPPPPARSSMQESDTKDDARVFATPGALGSPFPSEGLLPPPSRQILPPWVPPDYTPSPTSPSRQGGLTAAAALEGMAQQAQHAAGAQQQQQMPWEAHVGDAAAGPGLEATVGVSGAGLAEGVSPPLHGRPPVGKVPLSTGTRKSLLHNEEPSLHGNPPGTLPEVGLKGAVGEGAGSSVRGDPAEGEVCGRFPSAEDEAAAAAVQQGAPGEPPARRGSLTFHPFQLPDQEMPASPRSPFHSQESPASPWGTAAAMATGTGGLSSSFSPRRRQQPPFPPIFNTHLADKPISPPAAEALASSMGSSGGGGGSRASSSSRQNPFAWSHHQQQLATGRGQGGGGSWVAGGGGLAFPPPTGYGEEVEAEEEGSSMGWSAVEERLSSSNRSGVGGHEKRLKANDLAAVRSLLSTVEASVPRLALQLVVIAGPCAEAGATYVTKDETSEVVVGRSPGSTMRLQDAEVSGRHLSIHWSPSDKCWEVADLGSLNGTLLNGEPISQARKRGRDFRLSSDDILQLGTYTKIKVSTFPREMLDTSDRHGSLPVGSLPKTLSVPKHRIPSFTSLLSPKINTTPVRKATVAAASDELRLECCIVSRAGRDHLRKGQVCEDVASAACPLPCDDTALPEGTFPSLFCVFDGHCGRGAAEEANNLLPDELAARLPGCSQQLADARGVAAELREAFLSADDKLKAEEGCTATSVLAWRDSGGAVCLQAANVGDSAALFISPATGAGSPITEDHRLSNPRERERLQNLGIQVTKDTRRLYGLNLARGLGDKFLKDEDLGLSAEPFVSSVLRVLPQEGGMLLIASDGLWDFADTQAVTDIALEADREHDGNVLEVAGAVIGHAIKQRTRDDVTVLVARIWPEEEWEMRSPMKNLDDGASVSFVSN